MSSLRSFKPRTARSAMRRYQHALGQVGANGKRTLRARRRDAMIGTAGEGEAHVCEYCEARALVTCRECAGLIAGAALVVRQERCRCPKKSGFRVPTHGRVWITLEHNDGCRLLKDAKPVTAKPDVQVPERPALHAAKRKAKAGQRKPMSQTKRYSVKPPPEWGARRERVHTPTVAEVRKLTDRHQVLADLHETIRRTDTAAEARRRVAAFAKEHRLT